MATTTTNYELTKAGYNDIPDIETINDNMDILDSSLVVGESNDNALATITKTTGWTNADPVTLGDKFQSSMTKISTMIKNLKWIYKFIGSTDISSIGDGTITNAISTLSSGKLNASDVKTSLTDTSTAHALSTASGKALNDSVSLLNANQARTFASDIMGRGILERCGKVRILHFGNNIYNPEAGTILEEADRPLLEKGVWAACSVGTDYTNNYRLVVNQTGSIRLQKNGSNVSVSTDNVRGQVVWVVA